MATPHDIKVNVAKRRTFAIISHPDAGKTTMTEKLLLYGGAVHLAGSVKGNKGGRAVTSDWGRGFGSGRRRLFGCDALDRIVSLRIDRSYGDHPPPKLLGSSGNFFQCRSQDFCMARRHPTAKGITLLHHSLNNSEISGNARTIGPAL